MPIVRKSAKKDPKLRWFDEARFGMFVHFGIYAQVGRGEWIQYRENIPRTEYEKLMHTFNPSNFDADSWVDLAERAGCRYIAFTAKHHDGFCMFDSALTDYKITNTPFRRDITGELIEACHRRGMRIVLYYSPPDWHHPNFVNLKGAFKDLDHPPATDRPDWPKYLAYFHGQIEELCTKYGRIDGIWFDGSHKSEKMWQGRRVYRMIKKHQPGAVVNDRCRCGDFFTPERSLPENLEGYLFEACQSVSAAGWGYNRQSPQFSVPNLVENLVRLAAAGGNFLLNVGPLPDGTMPPAQVERMEAIGRWLKVNGEAIYGSQAGAVETGSPDVLTTRKRSDLFLHLLRWPATDRISVPGVRKQPLEARLLGSDSSLDFTVTKNGLEIRKLPPVAAEPAAAVIKLCFDSPPPATVKRPRKPAAPTVQLRAAGRTVLSVADAVLEGLRVKGWRLKLEQRKQSKKGAAGKPLTVVTGWATEEQRLKWRVAASRAGRYRARIRLSCRAPYEGAKYVLKGAVDSVEGVVRATPSGADFRWQTVGTLRLPKGTSVLALRVIDMPYGYVFADIAALELTRGAKPSSFSTAL